MENVERQEEREQELKSDADELEQTGDDLEKRGEEFGEQVGELREEWEQRQGSLETPGAQNPDDLAETVETEDE